jgi:hypothetical protein
MATQNQTGTEEEREAQEAELSPRDRFMALHCESCGRRFRAKQWQDGMTCPKCHSEKVRPVVAPGGAVDYFVADRSRGYTPADVRFAQWAKWCGLVTQSQYDKTFIRQNRLIQERKPIPPIHEIMVAEGFLSEGQAIGLLEFMSLPRPDEDDESFLELMTRMADVDPNEVEKIKKLQRAAAEKCHEVPPICQLLVEKRVIREPQMVAMLKFQERNDAGCLKRATESVKRRQGSKRGSFASLKSLSLSTPLVRNAVLVAGLLMLGLGLLAWQAAAGAEWVYVKCTRCGTVSEVRSPESYPAQCPRCAASRPTSPSSVRSAAPSTARGASGIRSPAPSAAPCAHGP